MYITETRKPKPWFGSKDKPNSYGPYHPIEGYVPSLTAVF
jgi:hypothetical protein